VSVPSATRELSAGALVLGERSERRHGLAHLLSLLARRKIALVGLMLMIVTVAVGLVGPALVRDPLRMDVTTRLTAPGTMHWFGTDDVGRDVLSRVVYGARLSLLVGASTVVLAVLGGIAAGLVAGFYRSLDNPVMRVMDGLMAFPAIILAIALMASLGPSVANVIVALGVVYCPRVARTVRGSVLVIRETPYVEAARALGASDVVLLLKHVFPNCLSPVIVQASFVFAAAVLSEAALSFLGVGVPPFVPSWGNILSEGRLYLIQAPWLVLYPGAAIMITILGLNLFGDGLRDLLDPREGRSLLLAGASDAPATEVAGKAMQSYPQMTQMSADE
jgi:peptide/nickel transport system permease protein